MNQTSRRRFLKSAAASASLVSSSAASSASPARDDLPAGARRDRVHCMAREAGRRAVLEAPRRTPVAAEVDVLVCGGGPTGVGAALAAARCGARTLLVERHGMLGGVWTAGLLNPLFDWTRKGWIVAELVQRLEKAAAWQRWKFAHTFDTEAMKFLLEEMMAEAKVQLRYYTLAADTIVEDGQVRGIICEGKSGREAILAAVTIDCTGDGDVAARGGAAYHLGRMQDGLCQPMTLMFEIEGVAGYQQKNTEELYDALSLAIRQAGLDVELPFGRVNYAPWVIHVPRAGAAAVQATHVYRLNAVDTSDLTKGTIEARRQAHDLLRVMCRVPGLENARLVQTAPAIGVREARRICGRYTLTLEDLRAGRWFDDPVTFGGFCVDIHDVGAKTAEKSAHHTPVRPYEIPYRCLLPSGLEGLLVAGRCISGSHEAHASYRVTGTCMAMGQAAGLAAATAAAGGRLPSQLDGRELWTALAARGVGRLAGR